MRRGDTWIRKAGAGGADAWSQGLLEERGGGDSSVPRERGCWAL